jgi:CBS domain-containing protein
MKRVKDYHFKDLSTVSEESTIRRVIQTMRLHRLRAIPVTNHKGEYIGSVSEQTILDASIPDYIKSIYNTSFMADIDQIALYLHSILDDKVTSIIDKEYPWVSPSDSMSYAADLLARTNVPMLPVLNGKMVIGMITRIEILSISLND